MELQNIQQKIYEVRGVKVMLDFDLADLYNVETKVLNQTVKRNEKRFPPNFMFRLSEKEFDIMRSQIVTAPSQKKRNRRAFPFVFTEHGVTMLASVLRSEKAILINIAIVEAFIDLRKHALNHSELSGKIKQLEKKYDQQFDDINEAINYLLKKDTQSKQQQNRKQIGFS